MERKPCNSKQSINSDEIETKKTKSDKVETKKSKKRKLEPWDEPIDNTTTDLLFMPADPSGTCHMEKLEEYTKTGIGKLEQLTIDLTYCVEDNDHHRDVQITTMLNQIFSASCDSLEELTFLTPIGHLPGKLTIPLMPKVVKLNLSINWWGDNAAIDYHFRGGELFPAGFRFDSSFPNLRDVTIELSTEVGTRSRYDLWKNCLKSVGIARSVRNLSYHDGSMCGFNKVYLRNTFPKAAWSRTPSPDISTPETSPEELSDEDEDEENSDW